MKKIRMFKGGIQMKPKTWKRLLSFVLTFAMMLSACTSVSYTHLTLPTTSRV